MQKIYLIRHAQPDRSRTDLPYHIPPGPPLTPDGLNQAHRLAAFLRQAGLNRLYTSPLERCAHTARIVGEMVNLSPAIRPELIEWQPGDEPAAVRERQRPLVEQVVSESEKGPVALFSHGWPIGVLLLTFGMSPAEVDRLRVFDGTNPVPMAGAWLASRPTASAPWTFNMVFNPYANQPTSPFYSQGIAP